MLWLDIGRREQGKTTLAYWMARRVESRLIFDPRGMVRLGTTTTTKSTLQEAVGELLDRERAEVVYTPYEDVQAGFARFVAHARRFVVKNPRRPLAVLVDEVAFVSTDDPAFQWLLRCSARDVVQIFVTAHRPADIPTKVRAIADHWLVFSTRQEHDLRTLKERCSEKAVRDITQLAPRQFVHWDDARGESKVFRDPSQWYVNLDPKGERTRGPAAELLTIEGGDEGGAVETPPLEPHLPFH